MPEIYLDHNATTPLAPEVREAMAPYLGDRFGNASCGYGLGREAREAVDGVRRSFMEFLGCARSEVVFTSGGTEANNMALKGAAWARRARGRHIVIGAAEHPSVSETARWLVTQGFELSLAPVDEGGQVTPEALASVLRQDTILVSVMTAQNEVGTINRLDELAEVVAGKGIVLHTDAAQAVGKIPTAFPFLGVDLMTIVGHKFYGPKGSGALLVRRGLELVPLLHGGGQESARRSGTEDVASIVGLGAAIDLSRRKMAPTGERMIALRDGLHLLLAEALTGVRLNGRPLDRLPNTLNLSFLGARGTDIAARCPELLLATGAACHAGAGQASPTFAAMGLGPERSSSSLRISLGRSTTWREVQRVAEEVSIAVRALRSSAAEPLAPEVEATSDRPICPRCEQRGKVHPLRLELQGLAPAVVCTTHPGCRYEAFLAAPAGLS